MAARAADDDLRVCCGPATARWPTRRARWSGSATSSTSTGSARCSSPGSRSGKDAEAVAVRDGRPQLLLADGRWEEFPLDIAK